MTDYTPSATLAASEDGRQYHIGLAPGEVAEALLLVGDPGRVDKVAERFDQVELRRTNREYVAVTGLHRGLRVTVLGTGMGADNTEIAVVELAQLTKAPTMIRCGSTGALQAHMELGDLVVTTGAYRLENTSTFFVGEGYPAVAHHECVCALLQAADSQPDAPPLHAGITATAPGFYGAQGRDVPGFPPRDPDIVAKLERQGVLNLEMEASALLTLASLRGFRAGAVCAVYASRHRDAFIAGDAKDKAESDCIGIGLEALHVLDGYDRVRGSKARWHPGLGAG